MVNKMLKNQKRVFWEALLVTFVVFIFGILLGISYESIRVSDINDYYAKSEISLMDILAFNNLVDLENARCKDLIDSNIEFADRIYEEAILLEDLENLGKVTDDFGTNFCPRSFKMKNRDKEYTVATYFWIYQSCVKNGDFVEVYGNLREGDVVTLDDFDDWIKIKS